MVLEPFTESRVEDARASSSIVFMRKSLWKSYVGKKKKWRNIGKTTHRYVFKRLKSFFSVGFVRFAPESKSTLV